MRHRVELSGDNYSIVELSADGQYIIATSFGNFTRADGFEITRSVYSLGVHTGITCFLYDVRKAHNVDRSIETVRHAAEDIPEMPELDLGKICVALVVDPSDHSHDFYAAFMTSQGIDTTLFWDYDKAVEHLKQAAKNLNHS